MRTNNVLLLLIAMAFVIGGCKESKKADHKMDKQVVAEESVDMHSAKDAIDWQGNYFGVIPCASCPGINTLITLNSDGTYVKTEEYINSGKNVKPEEGKIIWGTKGNMVQLGGDYYAVQEGSLKALDSNKKMIGGEQADSYVLSSAMLKPVGGPEEGYTMQMFKGNDGMKYNVLFNTNPKVPTALVSGDGFTQMLSQINASAKGAEYASSNMQLMAKDNKATLTKGGEKVVLTEVK